MPREPWAEALAEIPWALKAIRQDEDRLALAVRRSREAGASWQIIGEKLGISSSTAARRYGRRVP